MKSKTQAIAVSGLTGAAGTYSAIRIVDSLKEQLALKKFKKL